MDMDATDEYAGLAGVVRVGTRFALTVGVAALGVVAAVSLAGRDTGSPARTVAPLVAGTPSPLAEPPSEFRLVGIPEPPAYFFIVGSDTAREELARALDAEALVRMAIGEPARVTGVVIAESDSDAAAVTEAVQRDAAMVSGDAVTAIEVIDLR